jgi:AcrR family transcriptional regulator
MARPSVLSRERVLSAAVALLDREGLAALSMRRLGEELGVEAMSLYRYVDSKAALLDGVVEAILGELDVGVGVGERAPARGHARWVEPLRARARALLAVLKRHPRALPLFATRPAVTPASIAHVEDALAVLRGAGFDVVDAVRAMQTVIAYVIGHALSSYAEGAPDEASRPAYGALNAEEFPCVIEASAELARWDHDAEFEYGLDAVLRGLAARQRGPAKPSSAQ